ncbi:DUF2332 domain-containing protein [Bacillus sp. FJAT-42376]|uniref:DUF2332 domain-containing protein n=1 Tax=Bacillus sp. FJAT-42376 TaxID=2014076 RepID=UPI000F5083DE|nr:DUF2332 domain-containing protein [Bacillus sp. FJAT-42376]AZB42266.1 DUF2332 domain-containing protein [Bacillus sp. FJAT-42376]
MNEVRAAFLRFAENECKGSSSLYEYLSKQIADDEELLQLAKHGREGQPIPNLFLGAVHYLLLKRSGHMLMEIYENPPEHEDWFPVFKDFCLAHQNEITVLLKTKLVQTNEVRRCAYLYPVFQHIHEQTGKPLALVEIGTSAGLQLLADQYAYSYGTDGVFGNPESSLLIHSEWKGENKPPLQKSIPPVAVRIGMDLNIVDVKDPEEYLWMKALIWPEHKERMEMFDQAAALMGTRPVQFFEGDGTAMLLSAAGRVPDEYTLCIFHTHVANQMPEEAIGRLLKSVKEIGQKRDVFHIYNNIEDRDLHLDYTGNGVEDHHKVAETDGHGRWFKWLMGT